MMAITRIIVLVVHRVDICQAQCRRANTKRQIIISCYRKKNLCRSFLKLAKDSSLRDNVLNFTTLMPNSTTASAVKTGYIFLGILAKRLAAGETFGLTGKCYRNLRWNHIFSNKLFLILRQYSATTIIILIYAVGQTSLTSSLKSATGT